MVQSVSNLIGFLSRFVVFLATDVWPITLTLGLGAVGVYFLLPRPRRSPARWLASLLAVAALVAGALFLTPAHSINPEIILFYVFSGLALISGGLLVTQRDPARAALSFALVVLSTCGLFLLLAAPFLMAATIIVYAGAIIVTFLFVIMLAQQEGVSDADDRSREPVLSTLTGFVLLAALVYVLQISYEKSRVAQTIDGMLADAHEARRLPPPEARKDLFPKLNKRLDDALGAGAVRERQGEELDDLVLEVRNLDSKWADDPKGAEPETQTAYLDELEADLVQRRQRHGLPHGLSHQAGAREPAPLSELSGPAANRAADQFRYGPDGRPRMPHENTAYLGRSLFTDYLFPVELGGVLLLVAAVGAIAIAYRRATSERAA